MAGYLGSDFDASQPPNSAPRREGAFWLRDIRARLKTFLGVMFDIETGALKEGVVTSAFLETVSGLTEGTANKIYVDTKGRVVSAQMVDTADALGIGDDVFQKDDTIPVENGGTGTNTPPTDGQIPIGGSGQSTWSTITSSDSSITVTTGVGTLDLKVTNSLVGTFIKSVTVPASVGTVSILTDSEVGAGRRAYVSNVTFDVNGSTAWTGSGVEVRVQDTNASAISFAGAGVSALVANAFIAPGSTGFTAYSGLSRGTGGTINKGLVAKVTGGTPSAGSDVVVVVSGIITA